MIASATVSATPEGEPDATIEPFVLATEGAAEPPVPVPSPAERTAQAMALHHSEGPDRAIRVHRFNGARKRPRRMARMSAALAARERRPIRPMCIRRMAAAPGTSPVNTIVKGDESGFLDARSAAAPTVSAETVAHDSFTKPLQFRAVPPWE
jgi:hypothetical protein